MSILSLINAALQKHGWLIGRLPSDDVERAAQLVELLVEDNADDADFASLVTVLGKKNSQDAWHIRTAEKHELYCFLTTDFKLLDALHAQRNSARVKALKTKVMTPVELAGALGIDPVAPQLFSYTNASFPVRADLVLPSVPRRRSKKTD